MLNLLTSRQQEIHPHEHKCVRHGGKLIEQIKIRQETDKHNRRLQLSEPQKKRRWKWEIKTAPRTSHGDSKPCEETKSQRILHDSDYFVVGSAGS